MLADFRVCLDACVLANQNVCDLLLRLAERPRLYSPVFSEKILKEVRTVHIERLAKPWPEELADYWQKEVRRSFPEALIEGYEPLIPILTNKESDRHVLAAAIRGNAEVIVTFNLRDFPVAALKPWDIRTLSPQDYLITLFEMAPEVVTNRLHEIASAAGTTPRFILSKLSASVPEFSNTVANALGWEPLEGRAQK